MNKLVQQIWPKWSLPSRFKTTAWGGHHGSRALVLHDPDYSSITKAHVTSTKPVIQPNSVNKGITATSHLPRRIKETSKEFDLQEAVTNIGVQCIIASIKDK
jgi:hypothetical protein